MALDWQPAAGAGVEVAFTDPPVSVLVWRTAKPNVILTFTPDEWTAFTGGVLNGEFDHFGAQDGGPDSPQLERRQAGPGQLAVSH